jgi:hypothetical protein
MDNKIRFDSTIFSTPKRGEGGKSSYRGNCCPQIIEAFINQYNMHYLSDYAIGGGTTKDVCERLGVKGTWTDLRLGFDLMVNDIPDVPENIFYHPAYWNMNGKIIYSDTQYSWKEVQDKYGYDPRNTDLSQAPTWEKFVNMLNYTVLKQFAALEPGGHFGILMGDIKSKGMLRSMLFEIAKPGIVESVVIKQQHNCWSNRAVNYSGSFIPTDHEYFLILRKESPYILDFQITRDVRLDIRDSLDASWKDVVVAVLESLGSSASLEQIYGQLANCKKCSKNSFWKEKVRQTLQYLRDSGIAVSSERGVWALAA